MPRFFGLDAHKRGMEFCVLDEAGGVSGRYRTGGDRESLLSFAQRHLGPEDQLALGATFHTWALVELLSPFVGRLVVSNPLRTQAIALAKVKTDRIDAKVLADLLRCGYLPEVWQPDEQTRRWRGLTPPPGSAGGRPYRDEEPPARHPGAALDHGAGGRPVQPFGAGVAA
ncbi:MAG: transposase [Thermoanaerobaculia bacterium]